MSTRRNLSRLSSTRLSFDNRSTIVITFTNNVCRRQTYISLPWISNEVTLATLRFSRRGNDDFSPSHLSSLFHERIFHESPPQRSQSPLALRIEEILAEWTRWHVISRGGNSRYPHLSIGERRLAVAVIMKGQRRGAAPGSFRCRATSSQPEGSPGRSFEFSSRRREACRPSCILPFLDSTCERRQRRMRRHTHTHTHTHIPSFALYTPPPVYAPCGIRQGYRACSGVLLVVIGVGPTDHLNTRHCNHDSSTPPSLFLISLFPPRAPPWHSLCLSRSHRAFSSPCHAPHCPGNTSRLLPRRPSPHPLHSFPSSPRRTFATISRG